MGIQLSRVWANKIWNGRSHHQSFRSRLIPVSTTVTGCLSHHFWEKNDLYFSLFASVGVGRSKPLRHWRKKRISKFVSGPGSARNTPHVLTLDILTLLRHVLIWKIRDFNLLISKGSISWVSQETETIILTEPYKELSRHWRKGQRKISIRELAPARSSRRPEGTLLASLRSTMTLVPGVRDKLKPELLSVCLATADNTARVMLLGAERIVQIPSSSSLAAIVPFLQELSASEHLNS